MRTLNAWPTESASWPPVLAVSGWSGSGKTTLIEGLAALYAAEGLRVAAVKRHARELAVDRPGKDTDRLFRAAADVLALGPGERLWRCHAVSGDLGGWLRGSGRDYDLVLVEGDKGGPWPKLWVCAEPEAGAPAGVEGVLDVLAGPERTVERARRAVDGFLARFHREMPVLAAVLVGGAGRRMGGPKSLLRLREEPLLARLARVAEGVAERVVLAGGGPVPRECEGLDRLADVEGARGPLAGILAALRWRPDARWLVLACDLPLAQVEALGWLADQAGPGRWAVAPRLEAGADVEPLPALYDPPSAQLLEAAAAGGKCALRAALDSPRVHSPVAPAALRDSWTNVNTPEEWRRACGEDARQPGAPRAPGESEERAPHGADRAAGES